MSDRSDTISPWTPLDAEKLAGTRVFDLEKRRMKREDDGETADFFFIDCPDWVNVVALTDRDELVLVEQWRHARDHVTLEIPGGTVDPEETPLEAAERELLEETGYRARDWVRLGVIEPNPAILTNRCYTFLARGAEKVAEPSFDGNERCVTVLRPYADAMRLVADGTISHALVVVGLTFAALAEGRVAPPG